MLTALEKVDLLEKVDVLETCVEQTFSSNFFNPHLL